MRFESVCIPLWSLRHDEGDTIEGSVNTHPCGFEFRAKLNAELLHTQIFRDPDEMMRQVERSRTLLESRGWTLIDANHES
jgi:hypothetical protein